MAEPRILIIGGSGQLGRELTALSWPSGFEVFAPPRGEVEVTDRSAVAAYLGADAWVAVINAAAYAAVDAAEDGRLQRALGCFRKAYGLKPDHLTLACDIAAERRELNRLGEGHSTLETLLLRQPNSVHSWVELAHVARKRRPRTRPRL